MFLRANSVMFSYISSDSGRTNCIILIWFFCPVTLYNCGVNPRSQVLFQGKYITKSQSNTVQQLLKLLVVQTSCFEFEKLGVQQDPSHVLMLSGRLDCCSFIDGSHVLPAWHRSCPQSALCLTWHRYTNGQMIGISVDFGGPLPQCRSSCPSSWTVWSFRPWKSWMKFS